MSTLKLATVETIKTAKTRAARKTAVKAGAEPKIKLTKGWAKFLGALYGVAASGISFYGAHWGIAQAFAKHWTYGIASCVAVLGGLLLSAPTCFKFFLTLKGKDRTGIITAAGLVALLEISMSIFALWISIPAAVLVAGVNGISSAQQALKLVK